MTDRLSRRSFARATVGGAAAVWLAARWAEVEAALAQTRGEAPAFTVLSPSEAADLEAMAAQIIPTDDSPGAREAGVIHFIDRALATFAADQQQLFRDGLAGLRAEMTKRRLKSASFAALAPADQIAILRSLERAKSRFFEAVRTATIMGMFANPQYGGNEGKVGWRLLGFEDRFVWQPPFGDYDRPASSNRR